MSHKTLLPFFVYNDLEHGDPMTSRTSQLGPRNPGSFTLGDAQVGFSTGTAVPDIEDTGPPPHVICRSLPELLHGLTPDVLVKGEDVWFEVEGFNRSDLLLWVYVRPSLNRFDPHLFPLVRIELRGPVADDLREQWYASNPIALDGGAFMHGVGAFRSLISYLERELPGRGFKGIAMECVGNSTLRTVAERYGFALSGRPQLRDYVKHLGNSVEHSQPQQTGALGDHANDRLGSASSGIWSTDAVMKACSQTFPGFASYIPDIILSKVPEKPSLQKLKAAGLLLMIANEQRKGRAITTRQLYEILGSNDACIHRLVNEYVHRGILTKRKIRNRQGRGRAFELLFTETDKLREAVSPTAGTAARTPGQLLSDSKADVTLESKP